MKKIFAFIGFSLIFNSLAFTQQDNILDQENLSVWFKTTIVDEENSVGKWQDNGPYDIKLMTINNDGEIEEGYENECYSINYNPALYFGDEFEKYRFEMPKSLSKHHTIMAVLIPEQRVSSPQWTLYNDDQLMIRSLNSDYYEIQDDQLYHRDYGRVDENFLPYGSDLELGNEDDHEDEIDRYGKIITADVFTKSNDCHVCSEFHEQVFEIFSDQLGNSSTGIIPEFIVFNRVLTSAERINAESYLAIKYGISKYFDYANNGSIAWEFEADSPSCNKLPFLNRITGIGAIDPVLNQSKSNSYYDESVPDENRYVLNYDQQNYSNNINRSISISIEDESSTIIERWGDGTFLIWGDNDVEYEGVDMITLTENEEFERISRIWKSEITLNDEVINTNGISWCNFENMKNENGVFSRKYPVSNNSDKSGVGASSTETIGDHSAFVFTLSQIGQNGRPNRIGYSLDNYKLISPGSTYGRAFIYGVNIVGSNARAIWDFNLDGLIDASASIGQLSENDEVLLEYIPEEDGYNFKIFVNGIEEHSKFIPNETPKALFVKFFLAANNFSISDISGSGFAEQEYGGTNVEFSYERFHEFYPKDENDEIEAYLLVNTEGDEDFPNNGTTRVYEGNLSLTPNGAYDRIEFTGVDWGDECSVFTLAAKECNEWTVIEGDPVYDVCGNGAYIPISIEGCPINDCFNIFHENNNGEPITYCPGNEPVEIYLENGEVDLFIFPDGDENSLFEHVINIENENVPPTPEELPEDEVCFTTSGEVISLNAFIEVPNDVQVMYSWAGPNDFSSTSSEINLIEGIHEIGTYTVIITIVSSDYMCVIEETVEICTEVGFCDITVSTTPCDENNVIINYINTGVPCPDPFYQILDENGNDIDGASGSLEENTTVLLTLEPGNYTIVFNSIEGCCDPGDIDFTVFDGILSEDVFCITEERPLIINANENIPEEFLECVELSWVIADISTGGSNESNGTEITINPKDIPCEESPLEIELIVDFSGCGEEYSDCVVSQTITIYNCTEECEHFECPCEEILPLVDNASCPVKDEEKLLEIGLDVGSKYSDEITFEIWKAINDIPTFNIHSGKIIDGKPVKVNFPFEGEFYFKFYDDLAFNKTIVKSINYENILPDEIFEESIFEIAGKSITLDASENIEVKAEYLWEGENGFKSNEAKEELSKGLYSITVKADGCSQTDKIKIASLDKTVDNGIKLSAEIIDFKYANPIEKNQDYNFNLKLVKEMKMTLTVFNASGMKVKSLDLNGKEVSFDLNLPAGAYFMHFNLEGKQEVYKLIVQ